MSRGSCFDNLDQMVLHHREDLTRSTGVNCALCGQFMAFAENIPESWL